jgi:hypothetical protein
MRTSMSARFTRAPRGGVVLGRDVAEPRPSAAPAKARHRCGRQQHALSRRPTPAAIVHHVTPRRRRAGWEDRVGRDAPASVCDVVVDPRTVRSSPAACRPRRASSAATRRRVGDNSTRALARHGPYRSVISVASGMALDDQPSSRMRYQAEPARPRCRRTGGARRPLVTPSAGGAEPRGIERGPCAPPWLANAQAPQRVGHLLDLCRDLGVRPSVEVAATAAVGDVRAPGCDPSDEGSTMRTTVLGRRRDGGRPDLTLTGGGFDQHDPPVARRDSAAPPATSRSARPPSPLGGYGAGRRSPASPGPGWLHRPLGRDAVVKRLENAVDSD